MLSDLRHRLRALFRRAAVERDLDCELRFHLDHEIEKGVARGLTRDDAARQARLSLGGFDQIREAHRDARGIAALETALRDIRQGLRLLRRSPAFAATTIVTVALAVGALATVAALADALFLRPLPIVGADRAVVPYAVRRERPAAEGLVSYPDYVAFRGARTLDILAAHYPTAPLFVDAAGHATEINGAVVSANYFSLFDSAPALGRYFHADEDAVPDRDRVAVLAYSLWRDWFAASPGVLGSTLRINGATFTVVGVAPQTLPSLRPNPPALYIPTMSLRVGYRWCDDALAAGCTILSLVGRLAPDRTIDEARAELSTLVPASWARARVGENMAIAVTQPRGISADRSERRLVSVLGGVAIVQLLACCANLAGLLSAQAVSRAAEFATRAAIGAGPGRIARQFVTESTVLAAIGGLLSVAASRTFVSLLASYFYSIDSEGHPQRFDFHVSWGIALASLGSAIAAGVLFSLVAALRVARATAAGSLDVRRGAARWRSTGWILSAQAAVAVALAVIAGLLNASAQSVSGRQDFDAASVALMRLRPRLVRYPPERAQQFQHAAIARLSALPGVRSVSMTGLGTVLSGGSASVTLPSNPARTLEPGLGEVGPRYFETLRTPILAGREFAEADDLESPPVAIVNAALARRLWPDRSAVGEPIVVIGAVRQVVGVVADVQLHGRDEPIEPFVYTPYWQNPRSVDSRLCIRVAGDPAAMLPALVAAVHAVDPDVPIAETITLPTQLEGWMRPLRLGATFVGFTAAFAVALTVIGLYGALAFAVSTRTKEIGIRMALGAAPERLVSSIVGDGMRVILSGALVGIALAAVAARMVGYLLFRTAPADWYFYAAGVACVAAAGLLASWLPARRAAAIEPLVALRQE